MLQSAQLLMRIENLSVTRLAVGTGGLSIAGSGVAGALATQSTAKCALDIMFKHSNVCVLQVAEQNHVLSCWGIGPQEDAEVSVTEACHHVPKDEFVLSL
jgi:hypothetical protein